MQTEASPQVESKPQVPALPSGFGSSEFTLSLLVLAAVFAALWQGKIDSTAASVLIGAVLTAYPSLRTWLKYRHVGAVLALLSQQSKVPSIHGLAPIFATLDTTSSPTVRETELTPTTTTEEPKAPDAVGSIATPSPAGIAAPSGPTSGKADLPGSGAGVGPKVVTALLLCGLLTLSGCAQTVFYDRHSGKAIARFQGDMTHSHYADAGTVWDVEQVNHSTATLAQGSAAANVISSVGTAASGALLAAGSSGLFPVAGAVVSGVGSWVNRPAALQAK